MVWSDEFDGNSIDNTKWAFQNGDGCPSLCGWGNGELQTYTSNSKNIKVENGLLTMTVVKETVGQASFTSSKLRTLGLHSWTYGRFEARMKMPLGRGLWPAFWMLSVNNDWPMTGEIDIMEYRGDLPRETHGTLHYGAPWPNNRYDGTKYIYSQNLSNEFHVYAVEWGENSIKWYIDDVLFKTETKSPNSLNPASNGTIAWPWDSDFYLILNFAVGGGFTGNPGVNEIELTKPTFEVDYVRVYSNDVSCPEQVMIIGKDQILPNQEGKYSTKNVANASYEWNISGGGEIISGQGTNEIIVSWPEEVETNVGLTITYNSNSSCSGDQIEASKAVSVFREDCELTYVDFETSPTISNQTGVGSIILNTENNGVNTSSKAYQYTRNVNELYDVIFIDDLSISNGSYFENGDLILEMDVYTSSSVGTEIQLQIGSVENWQAAWPYGRHTVYSAFTTTTNQWETLAFHFSQVGDSNRNLYEDDLNRIVVLVNPNSTTNATFLIDNIRKVTMDKEQCVVTSSNTLLNQVVNVYPQPVEDFMIVDLPEGIENSEAILIDLNGKVIQHFFISDLKKVDLSRLEKGVYILKIMSSQEGNVFKIVKSN